MARWDFRDRPENARLGAQAKDEADAGEVDLLLHQDANLAQAAEVAVGVQALASPRARGTQQAVALYPAQGPDRDAGQARRGSDRVDGSRRRAPEGPVKPTPAESAALCPGRRSGGRSAPPARSGGARNVSWRKASKPRFSSRTSMASGPWRSWRYPPRSIRDTLRIYNRFYNICK